MAYIKLFISGYVEDIRKELAKSGLKSYSADKFAYDESAVRENQRLTIDGELKLRMPEGNNHYDFENAKSLFEYYKAFSPVIATDARIWTYLTHVDFWHYMKRRWPSETPSEDYILEHWFLKSPNPSWLLRNGISRLWWGAYLTYDKNRSDPYELTREAFSMLDYTRHLLPGTQGRSKNFVQALLEFVIENKDIFKNYKESKVRFLMRKANYVSGYKNFPAIPKGTIKAIFRQYINEIEKVQNSPEDDLLKEDT